MTSVPARAVVAALLLFVAVAASGCAFAVTRAPGGISSHGASVGGGLVSTVGGQTSYWVEYGPTTAYGSETPRQTTFMSERQESVIVTITGLERSATYHYRLCAADSQQAPGSAGCGLDHSFTTQSVDCGDTVTADVRLTGPMGCGEDQTGLVVGADGVEINLAGHTLSGAANPISRPTGIANSGHAGVTVRNGTLSNWGTAVVFRNAVNSRLVGLRSRSWVGADLSGGTDNRIRLSALSASDQGIVAVGESGLHVANSQVTGSAGPALILRGGGATVRDSTLSTNSVLEPRPGVLVDGSGNRLLDNRVQTATTGGSLLTGIWIVSGAGNTLTGNDVSGASTAGGGESAGDGMFVASLASGTLLSGNVAHDNADDGLDIRSASSSVGENVAHHNGDFGIVAVAGVTDLGGELGVHERQPAAVRERFLRGLALSQ